MDESMLIFHGACALGAGLATSGFNTPEHATELATNLVSLARAIYAQTIATQERERPAAAHE